MLSDPLRVRLTQHALGWAPFRLYPVSPAERGFRRRKNKGKPLARAVKKSARDSRAKRLYTCKAGLAFRENLRKIWEKKA